MRHLPLRELGYTLVFLLAVAAIYVGAYYLLVDDRRVIDVATDGNAKARTYFLVTEYKAEAAPLAEIFAPINAIDLRFRFPAGRVDEDGFSVSFVSARLPARAVN